MAPTRHVALVTGANRGIGYGIVRRLARQYPTSYVYEQSKLPLHIYIGSRSKERGEEALKKLEGELADEATAGGPNTTLEVCQLDIDDAQSRSAAVKLLQEREGGVDTLIDNAGIALDGFDADVVRNTLKTNFHSLLAFNTEILPIVRANGRVVILASMTGHLRGYGKSVEERFRAVSTVADAQRLAREFEEAVADGTFKDKGWKEQGYSTSKACVIAYTRGLANEIRNKTVHANNGVLVNCVCPGYVSTDMTKQKGTLTLDQGAATPVTVALSDINGQSGAFYEKEKESHW